MPLLFIERSIKLADMAKSKAAMELGRKSWKGLSDAQRQERMKRTWATRRANAKKAKAA